VSKVRRFVDHPLCKLPFEEAWFRERGCQATYVGHPYFDELRNQTLDHAFIATVKQKEERLVTILPGSRSQEVQNNLPMLLRSAERIRQAIGEVRIAIASYNERQAATARELATRAQVPLAVHVGRTGELIHAADCCLACSGSVSLELLYHTKPTVVVYKMPWLTYTVLRRFLVQVKYITLVNLLTADSIFTTDGRTYEKDAPGHENVLFPEYPTWKDRSADIAGHALEWLTDEAARQRVIGRLAGLRDTLVRSEASATAADYIERTLSSGDARAGRVSAAA
jgi:lipid-A-disaccharide synthase